MPDAVGYSFTISRNVMQDQLDVFQSTVHKFIEASFPTRVVETHSEDKPWLTEHCKLAVKIWQRV